MTKEYKATMKETPLSQTQGNLVKMKTVMSCVAASIIMIVLTDFLVANSFAASLDAIFNAIGNVFDVFDEFVRKAAWRPWFYLLGTAGFAMGFQAIKEGDGPRAVRRIVATVSLGVISFVLLDRADPGRVHRYNAYLTTAVLVSSVMLASAIACRVWQWKDIENDGRVGVKVLGAIGMIGLVVSLSMSIMFQTRIAELAEVSSLVEQKYGHELRSMRFETFYNDNNGSHWGYEEWVRVSVGGKTKQINGSFSLDNPDDSKKYLVRAGLSFEIGMIDNKPVVMIGSIDWEKYPRERVIRSVDQAVEEAMAIIRRTNMEVQSEKGNENGWRERLFKVEK